MEFKFSCKWFEIAFSGDPGFVETQLEKYEPYVLKMLERTEEEAEAEKKGRALKTEAKPSAEPAREVREQPRGKGKHKKDRKKKSTNRKANSVPEENHPQTWPETEGPKPRQPEINPFSANPGHEKALEPLPHNPKPFNPENSFDPEFSSHEAVPLPEPQSPPSPAEFPERRTPPGIRGEELNKIMDDKKPRTHHDRVMVFGYYMENEGEGSDFTISEIKKCYAAAGQEAGMNIEQVINHATRSGFIVRHDSGRTVRFKLSNKGRRYVDDGLKLA